MIGVFCSVIAGAVMSLQGVINTRLTERIGIFEANVFVQGTAFLLSFLVMLIFGRGDLAAISQSTWAARDSRPRSNRNRDCGAFQSTRETLPDMICE